MNADFYHESRQLWKTLWAYLFLTMFFLLAAAVTASSQTTWIGDFDANWNNAANWSAGVPDANDDVTIWTQDYYNPVISAAGAVAKSVYVEDSRSLTINAAGILTINGSTSYGIHNGGDITNLGTIIIGNTASVGQYGIENLNTFNNNGGSISIDRSTNSGIYNYGGTFTNSATITIGNTASVGQYGINNDGIFYNNGGGSISIDKSTISRIYISSSGAFTNAGTLNFGTSVGQYGIRNLGEFNNSSPITINNSTSSGIYNYGGTFNNSATITIGSTASVGQYGINNGGTFNNSSSISIDRSTGSGIYSTDSFANAGTITIGATASVGAFSINNDGTIFNNNSGGILHLYYGLETPNTSFNLNTGSNLIFHANPNWPTDNFNFNSGSTLTIGTGASLTIGTARTVPAGATLQVDGSLTANSTLTVSGILDCNGTVSANGVMTNTGTLNLNSGGNLVLNHAGAAWPGGTFNYGSGSTLTIGAGGSMAIGTARTVPAGASFQVDGSLDISSTLSVPGTLTNNGSLSSSGTISINNNGSFVNLGTLTVASGSSLSLTGAGAFTQSGGSATISGSLTKNGNNGGVNVGSGATLTIATGGSYTQSGGQASTISGTLVNDGSITNGNGRVFTVASGGVFTNNGTFQKIGTFNNNGTVNGTGSFSGNIFNSASGTYAPGSSPGCLNFGNNYTHSGGTLSIEVNGTTPCSSHDVMDVGGTATLSGTLNLSIGYTPSPGHVVTFIDAAAISGTFASVNPPLPSGWTLAYNSPSPGKVSISYALLPVELTSFRAELQANGSVLLDWETVSETNNKGFHIERLTVDGDAWTEIGFVDGHGSTLVAQAYDFEDAQPLPGTNYYRLRQVDFDGGHEYSKTVSVEVEGAKGRLVLFPNPASTEVNLRFSQGYEKGEVAVFDAMGRLVLRRSLEGGGEAVKLDATVLAKGIYTVLFQADGQAFFERLAID